MISLAHVRLLLQSRCRQVATAVITRASRRAPTYLYLALQAVQRHLGIALVFLKRSSASLLHAFPCRLSSKTNQPRESSPKRASRTHRESYNPPSFLLPFLFSLVIMSNRYIVIDTTAPPQDQIQHNHTSKHIDEAAPLLSSLASEEAQLGHAGSSISSSVFNLANSIIGAGILALPFAFQLVGHIFGVILLVATVAVADFSIKLLLRCGQVAQRRTYEGVAHVSFGNKGVWVVSVAVILLNIGAMTAYFVILGMTSLRWLSLSLVLSFSLFSSLFPPSSVLLLRFRASSMIAKSSSCPISHPRGS